MLIKSFRVLANKSLIKSGRLITAGWTNTSLAQKTKHFNEIWMHLVPQSWAPAFLWSFLSQIFTFGSQCGRLKNSTDSVPPTLKRAIMNAENQRLVISLCAGVMCVGQFGSSQFERSVEESLVRKSWWCFLPCSQFLHAEALFLCAFLFQIY